MIMKYHFSGKERSSDRKSLTSEYTNVSVLDLNFLPSSLSRGNAFSSINGQSLHLFLEFHTFSCSQGSYSVSYWNKNSTSE